MPRTTISMPDEIYERANQRKDQLGYRKFSHYVQALIRADILAGGAHIREASSDYKISPARPKSNPKQPPMNHEPH